MDTNRMFYIIFRKKKTPRSVESCWCCLAQEVLPLCRNPAVHSEQCVAETLWGVMPVLLFYHRNQAAGNWNRSPVDFLCLYFLCLWNSFPVPYK
uniref:Uncharacterized protein n=1 Tax=Anguilla anguilla TaxID=7936 RepID=A0A0E9WDM4_ANGAN